MLSVCLDEYKGVFMKRLRFFGVLTTILLLALGLALSCDNGTTETDDTDAVTTTFYDSAQNITITFSSKPIEARARAVGPNDGDYYQIKRGSALLSSGTIQLQGNGTTIKFIEDSGATFTGQFLNNLLTINDTVGGQALTVAASTPGTSGGGGPSTGPSGGGTSPSSGGGAATDTKAKINSTWVPTFTGVTDQGFTIANAATISPTTDSEGKPLNPGGQVPEYAAGLSTLSSPTTPWQKVLDFDGLEAGKEYAVWARAAAVTAAESADDKAYSAGVAMKGPGLVTTKAKGLDGAKIDTPFTVVASRTHDTITVSNEATVTVNPGAQDIEYAVSKDASVPTNGWKVFGSATFTPLDPVTKYYVWARSKYKEATGGNPAYSTGTAVRGDQQVETDKAPGETITAASAGQTLVTIAPGSASTVKEAGGELFFKPAASTGDVQLVEYTYAISPGNPVSNANDFAWWTPDQPTTPKGTAPNVGIATSVTLTTVGDYLKFTGLRGIDATTASSFTVYARTKENEKYKTGDTPLPLNSTPKAVLIPAPALKAITATQVAGGTTGGFSVTIAPTNADTTNSITASGFISALPLEVALGTATVEVATSWLTFVAAGTPFTELESNTTYILKVRVKEDTTYAQGSISSATATPALATPAGTANTDTVAWAPTIATPANDLKGLQFTLTGGATIAFVAPATAVDPNTKAEYGITEQSAGDAPVGTMIRPTTVTAGGSPPASTTIKFEGLKQGATYTLWVRKAANVGLPTGPWVKATSTPPTVKTNDAAAYPALAAVTIPNDNTRTTTGFTVATITATASTGQPWQVAVSPAGTNTTPPITPPASIAPDSAWVNVSSGTATISNLEAGKAYFVWIRSAADPGNYDAGTPLPLPIRGVTLAPSETQATPPPGPGTTTISAVTITIPAAVAKDALTNTLTTASAFTTITGATAVVSWGSSATLDDTNSPHTLTITYTAAANYEFATGAWTFTVGGTATSGNVVNYTDSSTGTNIRVMTTAPDAPTANASTTTLTVIFKVEVDT